MGLQALFQALESVQDINKIPIKRPENTFRTLPTFIAILGHSLHKDYNYTKNVYNRNKRYCNGLENQFINDYARYKSSKNQEISYENFIKKYISESIEDFNLSINKHMYLKIYKQLD